MRKIFFVAVMILLISSTAMASGRGEEKKSEIPELVIASSNAPDSLMSRMGERLEENINKTGVLKANFIKGQALGDMQQVMEQHMQGSVDIAFDRPLWFAPFVSDFQVLSWGFTFRDREHLKNFYSSSIYDEMKEKVNKKMGITVIHSVPDQSRVTFSLKPIKSIEDIKNMKMRVPRVETFIELWKTLGAMPTQIAWSEAFTSLRTGVVDAAESDVAGAWSQKFHQAAKYVTLTNHVMMGMFVSVNNDRLESLTDEQKEALYGATIEALEWASAESKATVKKVLDDMENTGAVISTIDTTEFQIKSKVGVEKMEKNGVWPEGLWESIQKID